MTYHDKKTSGLQLRLTATGVKTFSVFRRVRDGQPERVMLGRYPAMSIEQVLPRAEAIEICKRLDAAGH